MQCIDVVSLCRCDTIVSECDECFGVASVLRSNGTSEMEVQAKMHVVISNVRAGLTKVCNTCPKEVTPH